MANKKIMTKEELQAKHRLEEAQMRDRAKERKARTRRLIQEGAGGIPSVGRARALFTNCPSDTSPERAGNAASQHSLCSRRFC